MKDKIITLLQTIINKIRGLQMTAPIPQEKFTGYLEDVIGVVNDADLDVPSGGNAPLIVMCNFISVDGELSFEDYVGATFAEMVAAVKAGKHILAYCLNPDGNAGTPTWLCPVEGDTPGTIGMFIGVTDLSGGASGMYNEVAFDIAEDEYVIDNVFAWQKTYI